MISYCIASYRPRYSKLLIQDLIRKTTSPFEILLWLNVDDPEYDSFLAEQRAAGCPLRIIGKTPDNIGMRAYPLLFEQAQYELIAQIDDDVIAVSRNIAEQAYDIFCKFPRVKQLVADVWQDEFTTGARPPFTAYQPYESNYGLYDGPIDGWFSVLHRSALPFIVTKPDSNYFPLGAIVRNRLRATGSLGLLCTKFKVFHVIGPQYAFYFDMLDYEIEKYRRLGRSDVVDWYETARGTLPKQEELDARVQGIFAELDRPMNEAGIEEVNSQLEDPTVVAKIKETFAPDGGAEREHNARPGSAGFGSIHYALVTNLRPEKVLVIGSRYGYVPGMIGLALKANGLGTVDFVDANYSDSVQGPNIAFGGVENWGGEAAEKFSSFGLSEVINVHIMRSAEFFEGCDAQYDYIYLDGDHSYDGCKYDFEQCLKVAATGALLVLHDVAVNQEGFGVNRLFAELEEKLYNKILIPAWPGLGIIQRKDGAQSS